MTATAKATPLHNLEVYEIYDAFISAHRRNSEKTAQEYMSRVEEFFQMILGKHVRFLSAEEIQSIKNKDVQTLYVDKLLERKNSANTVVTKLRSVRSFYNDLLKNEIQVNPIALDVRLKTDVKHVNALTLTEYQNMLEFMKMESNGLEKYLLTKVLYHTANRKTATLNMTWEDNFIQKKDAITGEMVWIVRVLDKGKQWKEKPISDEFYEELQQIRTSEKVFPVLSQKGADKRYERSLKKYSKMIGKNISFHSLKATAITIGYETTKDINKCKQLGGHSNIATTGIYIRDDESYTNQLSYSSSRELDESALLNMTHAELLNFLDENIDLKTQIILRLQNK